MPPTRSGIGSKMRSSPCSQLRGQRRNRTGLPGCPTMTVSKLDTKQGMGRISTCQEREGGVAIWPSDGDGWII